MEQDASALHMNGCKRKLMTKFQFRHISPLSA
jgi:hypothetical protein